MFLNPYIQEQRQAVPTKVTTAKHLILLHPARITTISSLCSGDSRVIGFLRIAHRQKMTTTPKAPHVTDGLSLGDLVLGGSFPQAAWAPDHTAAKVTQQVAKPLC